MKSVDLPTAARLGRPATFGEWIPARTSPSLKFLALAPPVVCLFSGIGMFLYFVIGAGEGSSKASVMILISLALAVGSLLALVFGRLDERARFAALSKIRESERPLGALPVTVVLLRNKIELGRDEGFLWIDEGGLCFEGNRSRWHLSNREFWVQSYPISDGKEAYGFGITNKSLGMNIGVRPALSKNQVELGQFLGAWRSSKIERGSPLLPPRYAQQRTIWWYVGKVNERDLEQLPLLVGAILVSVPMHSVPVIGPISFGLALLLALKLRQECRKIQRQDDADRVSLYAGGTTCLISSGATMDNVS